MGWTASARPVYDVWMNDRDRFVPEDRERFEQMMKMMAVAEDEKQLEQIMLLFVFDLTYSRSDILMAEKLTKKEKFW